MRSDLIDIEVIFQHQTELAVCVREDEASENLWLPLSIVEIEAQDGSELRRGCIAIVTGPERFLQEHGLT